jgi:type IV secretion system protein VirD4
MAALTRAYVPDLEDYRPLGSDRPEALNLGRYVHEDDGITSKLCYDGERNLVSFGPNGSGKGTRIMHPNLLSIEGKRSILCIDLKGEATAISVDYRKKISRVVVLNPFGVLTDFPGCADLKSCGFNPLLSLDPKGPSFNSDASAIAAACCPIGGKDPYWDTAARSLTAACTMFAVLEAHGLIELLCMPSSDGNPRLDMPPIGLPALAARMAKSSCVGLRNKAGQFIEWTKDVQSVARTAMQHTECFDDDLMAADLAKGTFDFRDLKREPVTVYLILPPDQMERHAKWLRLVVTTALMVNLRPRLPGECRILFMLDEFFALGHMEIISTVWALVRGYGIQIWPILQDLNQLKKLYPDMWETFLGMAGAVTSFAPNDLTTAEWLSRRCGDTTRSINSINSSFSQGGGTSSGTNRGLSPTGESNGSSDGVNDTWSHSESITKAPGKVPLITPQQLAGLKPGYMILALAGVANVVPAYAPAYFQYIETCLKRAASNPYYEGS